ncbi:MAG: hypothetical protein HXM71_07270 [Mogibacterium diversum]|jgi:hypothetical protein|uniref:Uncharacterized protein n=1 Tax=Mogibacterium diversum TaxID=114527 RepID=A0A930EI49_9FIRM|nr:hypothetical protein [Mogibacterium diversum]
MGNFDPRVGPVNVNGASPESGQIAPGMAIFPYTVWAVAIYDVVLGVNYSAVVNAAGLATVYSKVVAIE